MFKIVCVYRQLCYLFNELNIVYTQTRPVTLIFILKDESCVSFPYFVNTCTIMFVLSISHMPVNSIAKFKLLGMITMKLIVQVFFESCKP